MGRRSWIALAAAAALLALIALLAVTATPAAFAELTFLANRRNLTLPPPTFLVARNDPTPLAGEVIDGFWRVRQIAPDTYAISEPQDDPDNIEYLLVGAKRALLIDAGATARNIHVVTDRLTRLPVTVIPSHLHWDHVNGLRNFRSVAMIDLPETRDRVQSGVFRLSRYQHMNAGAAITAPDFRVTEWIAPGEAIDLGGRVLRVLSTPGHTTNSVSISDPAAKLLFTGDYLYPTSLYAFMPDSSLSAYQATADRLLATLPADTRIWGAHCCRTDGPPGESWLGMTDLVDARRAVANVRGFRAKGGKGFMIRRYPVNSRMTLISLYPFGNW